jgi:hypothetical protein
MNLTATTYLAGAALVGVILIADNVILIRNKGVPNLDADGKALGLTSFFMLSEISWAGFSLAAILKGSVGIVVPLVYLIFVAASLAMGIVANATSGPVQNFHPWQVKVGLIFGCVFTTLAFYELALSI